jgi:hypothetical protein
MRTKQEFMRPKVYSAQVNPLVIHFASPVSNFGIFIANGDDVRSYTVSDNLGDSVTVSLPSAGGLGGGTVSLAGNGLTTVDITSANTDAWDFAVDDVTFTQASQVPEPNSLLLLGGGWHSWDCCGEGSKRLQLFVLPPSAGH